MTPTPCLHVRTYIVPGWRPAKIVRCRDCDALVYSVEGELRE
jgi:hypothetical protein